MTRRKMLENQMQAVNKMSMYDIIMERRTPIARSLSIFLNNGEGGKSDSDLIKKIKNDIENFDIPDEKLKRYIYGLYI